MGELANYTIDQVAGALALTLGSVGGLCLILFKSRCQRISICWGVWSCDRKVAEEDQEEVKDKPVAGKTEEEAIVESCSSSRTSSSKSINLIYQISYFKYMLIDEWDIQDTLRSR